MTTSRKIFLDVSTFEEKALCVKLGDDRSISANLVIGADGRNSVVRQRANLSLEQQSGIFDILWFKLADSDHFESENILYTIVRDRNAFGLFRSTSGNLQIGWVLHEDAPMDWKQAD